MRDDGCLRGFAACAFALDATFGSAWLAEVLQRPLRGPVFVDLGLSTGFRPNATSIAVGLGTYVVAELVALAIVRRSAPPWAFSFAVVVALLGVLCVGFWVM